MHPSQHLSDVLKYHQLALALSVTLPGERGTKLRSVADNALSTVLKVIGEEEGNEDAENFAKVCLGRRYDLELKKQGLAAFWQMQLDIQEF